MKVPTVMKAIVVILLLGYSVLAQSVCDKTANAIADIRGLKLGMLLEARSAPITARTRTEINHEVGQRWAYLQASELTDPKWKGIKNLGLESLDGKLSEIWVSYNDGTAWETPKDVLKVFAESLSLPIAFWEEVTPQVFRAKCVDFEAELIVGQDLFGTRYTEPSLRIFSPAIKAIIANRVRMHEDRKRKTFRP